jgi:hypothetical protein
VNLWKRTSTQCEGVGQEQSNSAVAVLWLESLFRLQASSMASFLTAIIPIYIHTYESLVNSTSLDKISVVIVLDLIPLVVAEMVADVHFIEFPLPRNDHRYLQID